MPNVWTFHKANLIGTARTNPIGTSPRYVHIRIGTFESPFYKSAPRFALRLENGRVLRSSDLTLETVVSISTYPWRADSSMPKGTVVYGTADYVFTFQNSKLVQFEAYPHEDDAGVLHVPVIGTYDQKHFYKMPLSQQQLIEVFGKPDDIKKEWFM